PSLICRPGVPHHLHSFPTRRSSDLRKDLHNVKYICPKNPKKEHDRLVAKKRDIQRKQDIEKKRARVEKAQKEFEIKIQKFIGLQDRKSTRLNSSHVKISYAVFCLTK